MLALCYAGDPAAGEKLIEPLRRFRHGRTASTSACSRITAWQQAFDPLLAPGARNYWKSHNFSRLSDGAIDAIIEYAGKLPSPQCEIFIGTIGGQTARVAPEAMAYSSRDANYVMNVHGRWESAAEDERRHCLGARILRQVTAVRQRRRLHQLPHRKKRPTASSSPTGQSISGWWS